MNCENWLKDVVCVIVDNRHRTTSSGLIRMADANGLLLAAADGKYLCVKEE